MEDLSERCQVQAFCGFLREYFGAHNDSGIRTVVFCDEEQAANYLLYELMASRLSWNCQLQSLLPHNIVSCSFRPGKYFSLMRSMSIFSSQMLDCLKKRNYFSLQITGKCDLSKFVVMDIFFIITGYDWKKIPMIQTSLSFNFDLGSLKVQGLLGDLTDLKVDAIVNSSNKQLDLSKGGSAISIDQTSILIRDC